MNFGWQKLVFEHVVLVIPLKDSKPHHIPNENDDLSIAETVYCSCQPKINIYEKLLIVHNSFDGREFFEDEIVEGAEIKWH